MAGILVSPQLDDRVRKRHALYKKRNESPKFRDILRERCHARIRASRCALLEKFRNLESTEELHSTLSGILKEELKCLTSSTFNPKGSVLTDTNYYAEANDEEDFWLIEEYDRILAEEEALCNFEWENQVICPICEMSVLSCETGNIICLKCHAQFPRVDSLHNFKQALDAGLCVHNESCSDSAQFVLLRDKEVGLFLICESCMCFSQVL